ncbi:hypothetical protein AC1031_019465 [Aphanomyces cochlioides]|nr:hypothetical protein AC1031_019465 [Aphanomyces cochlioides]
MFYDSAFRPILQADMLKLFALYYLGGLVVDLDVQALKPFPQGWTGIEAPIASCDVVVGIESDCYDDGCVKHFVRKGQVQNWAMFARRPRSHFLGELLEFIVAKYHAMTPLNEDTLVQEGNFSHPHYHIQASPLESDPSSILRIQKHNEEVCIVGSRYTGRGCKGQTECLVSHLFEGSWH